MLRYFLTVSKYSNIMTFFVLMLSCLFDSFPSRSRIHQHEDTVKSWDILSWSNRWLCCSAHGSVSFHFWQLLKNCVIKGCCHLFITSDVADFHWMKLLETAFMQDQICKWLCSTFVIANILNTWWMIGLYFASCPCLSGTHKENW